MATGDALGTTYEFERIDQAPYPALATGPATDIVGGGPFNLVAGQITDDTQMAICIARSLVHAGAPRAPIDLGDLATRYVAWFQHAFDVGNQTAASLKAIENGTPVTTAGRQVWHNSGRRAAGNGSLMRTTPIGVAYCAAPHERIVEDSLADSLLTHADPRCGLACAAFNVAIAHGVTTRTRDGRTMLEAGRAALPIAVDRLRELWSDNPEDVLMLERADEDLRRDLDVALAAEPEVYSESLSVQRTAGFVRVAFRLAFWHLVHTPSWRDALVDVASRGGDADTNAAIVGALLGARDGVHSIPAEWVSRVLGVQQPGPEDWAEAHHPRYLVGLVEYLRNSE